MGFGAGADAGRRGHLGEHAPADHEQKKSLYRDAGVGEYWIVDPSRRTITVVRRGEADRVERERVSWMPFGLSSALIVQLADVVG